MCPCQPWAHWPRPTPHWAQRSSRRFSRGLRALMKRRWTPVTTTRSATSCWRWTPGPPCPTCTTRLPSRPSCCATATCRWWTVRVARSTWSPGCRPTVGANTVRPMRAHASCCSSRPRPGTPRRPWDSIWCASSSTRWRATSCCSPLCAKPLWRWSPRCCGSHWISRVTSQKPITRHVAWWKRWRSAAFATTTSFLRASKLSWRRCASALPRSTPVARRIPSLLCRPCRTCQGAGNATRRRSGQRWRINSRGCVLPKPARSWPTRSPGKSAFAQTSSMPPRWCSISSTAPGPWSSPPKN